MQKAILILFSLFTITTVIHAQESNNGKQLWAKSYLNKKAPQLQVEKWLTAQPDTAGKFILVDFWATWCGPCRKFIPSLNEFQKKFKDHLVVMGISNESEEVVHKMKTPVIEYSEAIDPKDRTSKELEIQGIPHVLLIDPKGIVRWEGFPSLQGNKLTEQTIATLIEKYKS
ncbi:TlpA family protein disulfide reductase [Rhizosphaericola mali]|uniref:TlpA family protein disulfide reductase n=1 Tax=Rhizosphaericola mali TaxID=2545455 RepID=A0A5P2FY71_9BACT|nr:TlpA disulfide reductase family protein [Rhizosphaericola mali]QES87328.1 TlpA family protein disulfide reductase [Rhizosphaericola mali]